MSHGCSPRRAAPRPCALVAAAVGLALQLPGAAPRRFPMAVTDDL